MMRLRDDTLARAVLTHCLDGADALMVALVRGCDDACHAVDVLYACADQIRRSAPCTAGDDVFARGVHAWGAQLDARGMRAFHRTLARWIQRLDAVPADDESTLRQWLTVSGRQWIIGPHDDCWPQQLHDLATRRDWAPPLCLWGQGERHALVSCARPVSLVGSRAVSDDMRALTHAIAEQVSEQGHLVISGGAMGVDAAAHWGAVAARERDAHTGATVAVFAGGLNHIGPRSNERLFAAMMEHGGTLISELCPGTIPQARRFLLRNRIIAALSHSIIVTQARHRSGALNSANWGNELGRAVYAIPGSILASHHTGCNHLIRDGKATMLCSVQEAVDMVDHPHEHARKPAHTDASATLQHAALPSAPATHLTLVNPPRPPYSSESADDAQASNQVISHPAHPPMQQGTFDNPQFDDAPTTDDGAIHPQLSPLAQRILTMLHQSRRTGLTLDALHTRLNAETHNDAGIDVSTVVGALGMLECNALIEYDHGSIIAATGTGSNPRARPERPH